MLIRKVWLLVDSRKQDLSSYRLSQAEDSIKVAQMSFDSGKNEKERMIALRRLAVQQLHTGNSKFK